MRHELSPQPRRARTLALAAIAVAALLALIAPAALASTAYVAAAVLSSGQVSTINTATNQAFGEAIQVGPAPIAVAITPDGKKAYVANSESDSVSVIDTATNQPLGMPIAVGKQPARIAITPDGKTAYVVNFGSKTVSVIDTATDQATPTPIMVGAQPIAIAITPDGARAYVANRESGTVSVIDTATNEAAAPPINVGSPAAIAITPDGARAYVTNQFSGRVSVIDTATNEVASPPINVGLNPFAIAITPDGKTAYVVNFGSDDVSVIDTATNVAAPSTIKVGVKPNAIAITSDGARAYVPNEGSNSVSVIATATNRVLGSFPVGASPLAIAIAPNRPPRASFRASSQTRPGIPFAVDGFASQDPDGVIASYSWAFGDEQRSTSLATPIASHVYRSPGTYAVTLTVADEEGCSASPIFIGSGALRCQASPPAAMTALVKVSYPGVRLSCPKHARPFACRFALQAVAMRPRRGEKAQTLTEVAKARLKPGKSTIVSLVPKEAFAGELATVSSVLVKQTLKIGRTQRIRYRTLAIVQ